MRAIDLVRKSCPKGKATMSKASTTDSMAMTVPCRLMSRADAPRIVIVVPTLGLRTDFLEQTLQSIRDQALPVTLIVVCPPAAEIARAMAERFDAKLVDDPGSLPAAINSGLSSCPDSEYVTWLGDDDLLEPYSLAQTVSALDVNPDAVLAYGWCRYIDPNGRPLWVNKTGKRAEAVLAWGPQLIPQPGMVVRRRAWDQVGGVDESLSLAFDFDLILKLRRTGAFVCVNRVLASFRWHPESLTVSSRDRNLEESERVKRRYLRPWQTRVAWAWERPVRLATRVAAWNVNRKARAIVSGSRT